MPYDTKSLNIISPRLGTGENLADAGFSFACFGYRSADPIATVIAAAYIDDAVDKGLQVNDVVTVVDDNVPSIDLCLVTVVDVSTNPKGDATLIQLA